MAPWILTGVGNPQESHLATLRLGDASVGDASLPAIAPQLPAIAPQLPADCSAIPPIPPGFRPTARLPAQVQAAPQCGRAPPGRVYPVDP